MLYSVCTLYVQRVSWQRIELVYCGVVLQQGKFLRVLVSENAWALRVGGGDNEIIGFEATLYRDSKYEVGIRCMVCSSMIQWFLHIITYQCVNFQPWKLAWIGFSGECLFGTSTPRSLTYYV